jgi:hypothetical protein
MLVGLGGLKNEYKKDYYSRYGCIRSNVW